MAEITAPTIPGPIAETRAPKFALPPGSCDTHAHVFGPQSRYAYDPKRRYTPPDALPSSYIKLLKTLGFSRGVLVQASVYMTDNSAMLDALAETDFALRGVVATDASVTDTELERMHSLGVRGMRLNLRHANGAGADDAPDLARRIAPLGWHLNFRITRENYAEMHQMLDRVPLDIVVDHMGQVPIEDGLDGADFQALLSLIATRRVWLKLSGPMRISKQALPYADLKPFVQRLVAAGPDRMLFATDWPHTTITGAMPNDGDLVDLLADWVPDEATRKLILVDNPAFRYGF